MKTQITLLLASVVFFLAASCGNRAKQTTINGQVRTFGTQEAIKHEPVKVQILEEFAGGGFGQGSAWEVVAETWTDQNGNYILQTKMTENGSYYLIVDFNTVKSGQGYIPPSSIPYDVNKIKQVGGTFTQNIYLSAYGWVRFHFSITNHTPAEYFAYNLGGGASERFYGNIQITRKWDFGGNNTHNAAFTQYKDEKYSFWQDQIFVPAFDTIDYNISL